MRWLPGYLVVVLNDVSGEPRLVLGEEVHPRLNVLAHARHQQLLHLRVHLVHGTSVADP